MMDARRALRGGARWLAPRIGEIGLLLECVGEHARHVEVAGQARCPIQGRTSVVGPPEPGQRRTTDSGQCLRDEPGVLTSFPLEPR